MAGTITQAFQTPTQPPIAPPLASILASQTPTPVPGGIVPVHDQVVVFYVIVVYLVVIFGVWNIPGFRNLINPLKLFTIGWHELCHIMAAILSGGTILKVTIDPNLGGATIVQGGNATFTLSAGYLGSTLMGGLFVLAGWDTLVAKVMSFVLGLGLVAPLVLVRDKMTIVLTFLFEALLVAFWFIDHASALRWYCLFVGVMNCFYVVWDISDDKFFHKANDSDATQFSILYPSIPPHVWAICWIIFEILMLVAFVIVGIVAFKLSNEEMYAQAATFLPT